MQRKVKLKLDVDSLSNVVSVDKNQQGSTIIQTEDKTTIEINKRGNFHITIKI